MSQDTLRQGVPLLQATSADLCAFHHTVPLEHIVFLPFMARVIYCIDMLSVLFSGLKRLILYIHSC